jgi:hypothetical protein
MWVGKRRNLAGLVGWNDDAEIQDCFLGWMLFRAELQIIHLNRIALSFQRGPYIDEIQSFLQQVHNVPACLYLRNIFFRLYSRTIEAVTRLGCWLGKLPLALCDFVGVARTPQQRMDNFEIHDLARITFVIETIAASAALSWVEFAKILNGRSPYTFPFPATT